MSIYDPVPSALTGDTTVIQTQAQVLQSTADALRDAASELRKIASDDITISEAVDAVRDQARDSENDTDRVETRYRGAAQAMFAYKANLSAAQSRAESARGRIQDNNANAAYWRRRENELRDTILSGQGDQEILDELEDVQRRVTDFANEFVAAMNEYNAAESDKQDAVTAAIGALEAAADAAGLNDGFWDRVGAVLEAVYEWAQEHLAPWIEGLRALLEVLKSIVDILALIATVLSIFMPFLAPLAAALTLVSVALAGAILLCSLALFALGKESLGRVLGDAIGVVVGVVTAKLGGVNVFKPGTSLAGLSNVFTRSAWSTGFNAARVEFQIVHTMLGTGETVGLYGTEIASQIFKPRDIALKLGTSIPSEFLKGGLDLNLDFFPEGGGNAWGGDSPAWDLSADETQKAIFGPIADVLSGGVSNPVIGIVENAPKVPQVFGA